MTLRLALLLALGALLAACSRSGSVCPPGSLERVSAPPPQAASDAGRPGPLPVTVGGRTLTVDQVVEGLLCHGEWRGTVYVSCDIQVLDWGAQPTFLDGCDLTIEPGTVVYVASHNDTPYFNGCSCHFSDRTLPQ